MDTDFPKIQSSVKICVICGQNSVYRLCAGIEASLKIPGTSTGFENGVFFTYSSFSF